MIALLWDMDKLLGLVGRNNSSGSSLGTPDDLFFFHLVLPRPACGGPRRGEGKIGGHPRAPGHGTASPGTPC